MVASLSAPAKINLGLHVLRRRGDGFHDIETVFLRIGWADRVTVRPARTLALTCSDPTLPTDARNLCMQAALRLRETLGVEKGAAMHLEKRVPHGAGLGGGSSDAAATLRLLAGLWEAELSEAELHALSAGLGSDVPFFLGPPAAVGAGRGERLTSLLDPQTGTPFTLPYALVVVKPPVSVATAEAYAMVRPSETGRADLPALVRSNDLARWRAELVNDFEGPVLERYPEIREVRERLLAGGAGYACLSGSGSAVFGVFEDDEAAGAAAQRFSGSGVRVWWSGAGEGHPPSGAPPSGSGR